jgi:hypothetical protein
VVSVGAVRRAITYVQERALDIELPGSPHPDADPDVPGAMANAGRRTSWARHA